MLKITSQPVCSIPLTRVPQLVFVKDWRGVCVYAEVFETFLRDSKEGRLPFDVHEECEAFFKDLAVGLCMVVNLISPYIKGDKRYD